MPSIDRRSDLVGFADHLLSARQDDERVENAATALGIAAIVGIVIAILGAIAFCVAAVCIYRRVQRKRRERNNQNIPMDHSHGGAPQYGAGAGQAGSSYYGSNGQQTGQYSYGPQAPAPAYK